MTILRVCVCCVMLFYGLRSAGQVSFSASETRGCDSLTVNFLYADASSVDTVTQVEWDFGNGKTGTGKTGQTVVYDSAASYTVSMTVNGNTTITRQHYIRVYPGPSAWFRYADTLDPWTYCYVFRNVPQPVDSIRYTCDWQFSDGGSGDTRTLMYTFQEAGTYYARLVVTDETGCADTVLRSILVEDDLDVPNVFTPNGDGKNDFFRVRSNGVTVYRLKIFSRSGLLVYEIESPKIIWDGKSASGNDMPAGIYFYTLQPAGDNGSRKMKGFFQLLR